ncbi:uncharacterized protein BJ171DRAFT_472093 [Polychytrium aggregatum]|uniref:uncharacterized protein n=1 Tax=Polychytrium aggregatum TaxID=110093 RepID=UPI0022FF368B|nr:uncharacterized protein BJ171DRAFT_472093 [Polychytrium aggregatum]KAI9207769.1 hypothetical protein BJ171DRAFT_472093 [Polychytrium aggregatum]
MVTGIIDRIYVYHAVAGAFLVSVALYHAFIWTSYSFTGNCQAIAYPTAFQAVQIVLYLYWLLVDVFTAGCLIFFLRNHLKKMEELKINTKSKKETLVAKVLSREIWRVCWAACLGLVTSSCAIAEFVLQTKVFYLRGSIMCISHFILVLSTIDSRGEDDLSSSAHGQGAGGVSSAPGSPNTAARSARKESTVPTQYLTTTTTD